jgi:enamine deaminase RidA (YjgF/YER057c/UK114 family)
MLRPAPGGPAAILRGVDRVPAETEWADPYGYSRAVRRGDVIEVAGTTAAGAVEAMDAGEQARAAMRTVLSAVEALGGTVCDVVRTRMFVVDIEANSAAVGRAHGEFFGEAMPAAAMLGVTALIDPGLLVEVEATAIVAG